MLYSGLYLLLLLFYKTAQQIFFTGGYIDINCIERYIVIYNL